MFKIKSVKEQNELKDNILKERLTHILPTVMQASSADMWISASKEYHEDMIFDAITPASYVTARRISIFVFVKDQDKIRRFTLSYPDEDVALYYESYWNVQAESQMEALKRLCDEFKPIQIALNYSLDFVFSDGLSAGLMETLREGLGEYASCIMNDDLLAIKLLEIRTPTELELYPHVLQAAFSVIEDTFNKRNIIPGVTTCADLENHMMQMVADMGLVYWFTPTMDLQREGDPNPRIYGVIQKGDYLHCDFGIRYMNLCTDTQRNAYVAYDDETEVPSYLTKGFAINNRFQDIVRDCFTQGKSGNAIFIEATTKAKAEGIHPCLYSHPCNFYGHGPGTTIGLYSNQNPIPVKGDIVVDYNTVFALELNVEAKVEGKEMTFYSEETVLFDEIGVQFLYKDRDQIYFIK